MNYKASANYMATIHIDLRENTANSKKFLLKYLNNIISFSCTQQSFAAAVWFECSLTNIKRKYLEVYFKKIMI
jgi:hypothetical protein